ncbi:MAG: HlyC/CorC family transporter [Clostridia bacterium]|nr:HlyC/CorC family transporter [Clostridia bacterium]
MDVPRLLAMAALVVLSSFFSATETAFSSLNKTRLKTLAEKNKRAQKTLNLAENYDKLISTILIGNNIVNIALASVAAVFFINLLNDAGPAVSTAVVTVVVLIFGEVTPKSLAKDSPEKFAMFATPLIGALTVLCTPLNFLFSQWKKLLSKIFKTKGDTKVSQEELLMLVDEVQQDGSIDTAEGDLLRNAIGFSDRKAEDILTHRVDLEAVPLETPKSEIAKVFEKSRFSRILVYKESIDNIVGVIHQKDFYVGDGISKKPIEEIITPPLFIHQYEKITDILKTLQKEKSHIAIVIDEYGGTLGIVTMEDILEELVGDIWDEHDEVEEDFRKVSDDTYVVDGAVNLDDFCEFFDIECESDSVSVGGWVMEQVDKIPDKGDQFDYENLHVRVSDTDGHRVTHINVTVKEKTDEDDPEKEEKDD